MAKFLPHFLLTTDAGKYLRQEQRRKSFNYKNICQRKKCCTRKSTGKVGICRFAIERKSLQMWRQADLHRELHAPPEVEKSVRRSTWIELPTGYGDALISAKGYIVCPLEQKEVKWKQTQSTQWVWRTSLAGGSQELKTKRKWQWPNSTSLVTSSISCVTMLHRHKYLDELLYYYYTCKMNILKHGRYGHTITREAELLLPT